MKFKEFLSRLDENRIKEAISRAEKETSGEIRLHVDPSVVKKDPMEKALDIFYKIGMDKTRDRNGVLIYISTKEQYVTIIGDEGIHKIVGPDFWKEEVELITSRFRENRFTEGLVEAIERIGQKLKQYFPYRSDDINELPDEISKGTE